jgi:predicted type IV restriction endonuclease
VEDLLEKIRTRLVQSAFANEAAVSFGIVVPILQSLGWDPTEPEQVMPEYSSGRGRVDFALCLGARRPGVFIEVKGVGRSLEGDRQLFEYAFHEGVPLCVLTDGREWSFYLPSGQGSYEERRVYRLDLVERELAESERVLQRYLLRERVKAGAAFEAAAADYKNMAARREANRVLPKAWAELTEGPEDLLVELLSDQAEALCGFRPTSTETISFLRSLRAGLIAPAVAKAPLQVASAQPISARPASSLSSGRAVTYHVLGEVRSASSGNQALVDVLTILARRDPGLISHLAEQVKGNTRNHIARSAAEIYPARPDLARAMEFSPGWLVGLNVANREKVRIVRKACEVFGLRFGDDVIFSLPNE